MILAWNPSTDGPVEGDVVVLPAVTSAEEFAAWLPSVEGKFVAVPFAEPTCREDQSWQDHATPETFARMTGERDQARQDGSPARSAGSGAAGAVGPPRPQIAKVIPSASAASWSAGVSREMTSGSPKWSPRRVRFMKRTTPCQSPQKLAHQRRPA